MKKLLFLFALLSFVGCSETKVVVVPATPQPSSYSASGSLDPLAPPTNIQAFSQPGYTPPPGGGTPITGLDDVPGIVLASPAAGDVLRWDDPNWINGPMNLAELADITNVGSAVDGQVLKKAGGGYEFGDDLGGGLDASGITSGYIPTADGADDWDWAAPTVGGLLTPDGSTTITRGTTFNPRDYGASYLDTNAYVTSSTTTSTATFDATTNIVTTSGAHGLTDGDGVCFTNSGGALPTLASGTLDANTRVWVDVLSSTTFSTHTTRAAAIAGTGDQDYTSTGTGTHTARLKTTVTFTDGSAANTWEEDQYILLLASGPSPTITAPQTTVDSVTASFGTAAGTNPTFSGVALTNIVDLNLTTVPLATADEVYVSSSTTLPGGLAASTSYYVRGPIETQTIVIAGTPTGGTYTISWGGNTTSALAFNADEATVETALRLLTGLSLVEVTTTGSTPNYTHTVQMVGTTGHNIAQMTSASSLTGGTPTITHATTDHGRDKWILYTSSGAATTGGGVGLVDITDTGSGTHTMTGRTAHYSAFSAGDGMGGWTEVLALGPVYQFNYRNAGQATYGIDWQIHTPIGSRSIAWYGFGSSGRELVRVTGAEGTRYGADDSGADSFTGVANNGGLAQFTGYQTIAVNDIVEIQATSSGDAGYDGQYRVTATNGSSNFTANVAYGSTATGYWQRGYNMYRDFGQNVPLQSYKYLPNVENAPYEWRASTHYPHGTNAWDATNNRLWTVEEHGLTNPFDSRTGASAPSWNTSVANSTVNDGKIVWRLAMPWVPWTEPVAARRQAMTSKVQSKTSTTVVLQDAAFGDIGSSSLYAAHDDTMPVKNCFAAMFASGKDATLELSPGELPIYTWKVSSLDPDGIAWYTDIGNSGTEPRYTLFALGDTNQSFSVKCDPNSTIRWRAFESCPRLDLVTFSTGTTTPSGLSQSVSLFATGGKTLSWEDGRVIWEDFCGGLSEHLTSASFGTAPYVLGLAHHLNSSYDTPQNVYVGRAEFYAPNWASSFGDDNDEDRWSQAKVVLDGNIICAGGPDGGQTFLPHGNLDSRNNWLISYRRVSSHGYYWNVDKYDYSSRGDRFYGFTGANNYPIQIRGSSGTGPTSEMIVTDMIAYGSSQIILGDTSSSNPVRKFRGSNIQCSIEMAEAFDIQLVNTRGTIYSNEGGADIEITNHHGNINFSPAEPVKNVTITNVNDCNYVAFTDVDGGRVSNVQFNDNSGTVTESVSNATTAWVLRSGAEYVLTNRATGRPYTFTTTPTRLIIEGRWTTLGATVGSLVAGTGAYGDFDGYGENVLVIRVNGDVDPDTEPDGSIAVGTNGGNTQLLRVSDLHNVTFDGVSHLRTDGGGFTLVGPANGATSPGVLSNTTFRNFILEEYIGTAAASKYGINFGSSANCRAENVLIDGFKFYAIPGTTNDTAITGTLSDTSSWTLRNLDMVLCTGIGVSDISITSNGNGKIEDSKLQGDERLMTLSESADTLSVLTTAQTIGACSGNGTASGTPTVYLPSGSLTYDDAFNNLPVVVLHPNGLVEKNYITDYTGSTKIANVRNNWNVAPTTNAQVQVGRYDQIRTTGVTSTTASVRLYSEVALPNYTVDGGGSTALVEGETYYRGSNGQLYLTEANAIAAGATGNLEFAGSGNYTVTALVDWADASEGTTAPPFDPDNTHPAEWVKGARNVNLRGGGGSWKYAEVTASQTDNLNLYPVDVHLFTTDDTSNLITGFNGGWPGRTIRVLNQDSADNLNFDHNNGEADSREENKFISPTGADFVLGPNEMVAMVYIGGYGWVIQNYVAQNEATPLELFDEPLWAWEPKRHFAWQLAA